MDAEPRDRPVLNAAAAALAVIWSAAFWGAAILANCSATKPDVTHGIVYPYLSHGRTVYMSQAAREFMDLFERSLPYCVGAFLGACAVYFCVIGGKWLATELRYLWTALRKP
jgi:hypothetical protein